MEKYLNSTPLKVNVIFDCHSEKTQLSCEYSSTDGNFTIVISKTEHVCGTRTNEKEKESREFLVSDMEGVMTFISQFYKKQTAAMLEIKLSDDEKPVFSSYHHWFNEDEVDDDDEVIDGDAYWEHYQTEKIEKWEEVKQLLIDYMKLITTTRKVSK